MKLFIASFMFNLCLFSKYRPFLYIKHNKSIVSTNKVIIYLGYISVTSEKDLSHSTLESGNQRKFLLKRNYRLPFGNCRRF